MIGYSKWVFHFIAIMLLLVVFTNFTCFMDLSSSSVITRQSQNVWREVTRYEEIHHTSMTISNMIYTFTYIFVLYGWSQEDLISVVWLYRASWREPHIGLVNSTRSLIDYVLLFSSQRLNVSRSEWPQEHCQSRCPDGYVQLCLP